MLNSVMPLVRTPIRSGDADSLPILDLIYPVLEQAAIAASLVLQHVLWQACAVPAQVVVTFRATQPKAPSQALVAASWPHPGHTGGACDALQAFCNLTTPRRNTLTGNNPG